MTDPAVKLEVRHIRLADSATLQPAKADEGDEGVFVALAEPPPVRTVLTVVDGETRRALEVTRVVEIGDRDERGERGFYARWVEGEAIERATKVGTEHLEDGTPQVQPVSQDNSAAINLSDSMAMPAPVVLHGDEDDSGDEEREDADGSAEEVPAQADDAASEEGADASAEAASTPEAEATPETEAAATPDESGEQKRGKRSRGGRRKRGKRGK